MYKCKFYVRRRYSSPIGVVYAYTQAEAQVKAEQQFGGQVYVSSC